MNSNTICSNIETIRERIAEACTRTGRDPESVELIAISKTRPVEEILQARECNQLHFGENRIPELQEKMEQIPDEEIVWHFVGAMQTNKIRQLAGRVDWIHSIWKRKYLDELEKRLEGSGRKVNVLIQVNISNEPQKHGCRPEEVRELVEHALPMKNIRVRGLMGMATFTEDEGKIREEFRLLRETFDKISDLNGGAVKLEHLSMGMTNDLEIAVEEGSTMVRVGTALFGERRY